MKIPAQLFPNELIKLFKRDTSLKRNQPKKTKKSWSIDGLLEYVPKTVSMAVGAVVDFVAAVVKAAIASSIAFSDTVLWVAIVFSMAAPMILSGLYEASVDRQVLETIEKGAPIKDKKDGNKTSPAPNNEIDIEKTAADNSNAERTQGDKAQHEIVAVAQESPNTPPQHMDQQSLAEFREDTKHRLHLLYAILIGNLELRGKPNLHVDNINQQERSAWDDVEWLVNVHEEDIESTRMRLKSMLGSQVSFGASVGAPVVFFLGSFLFSIFGNLQTLGDNDTSHSVAFGEWWMTIPHVAIVSGCLLAGNNPNTFEGIICNLRNMTRRDEPTGLLGKAWEIFGRRMPKCQPRTSPPPEPSPLLSEDINSIFARIYGRFYESQYQPVWMWNRGQNKQKWINKVQRRYKDKRTKDKPIEDKQTKEKQTKERHLSLYDKLPLLNLIDWLYLILFAIFLILGPFVLAYLTAYYTPAVGLSCRSFTFVLYFICQGWLSITWGWKFNNTWQRTEAEGDEQFDGGEQFDGDEQFEPFDRFWFFCTAIGFCGAMLTTIAGTFMQLVGVYRNCKCMIPMNAWASNSSPVVLSTNTAQQIHLAGKYWLRTSITSIVWLVVTCYVGWWYQRRWRSYFKNLVDSVLDLKPPAQKVADADSSDKAPPDVEEKEVTVQQFDN